MADEIYVPLVCALESLRAGFVVNPDSIASLPPRATNSRCNGSGRKPPRRGTSCASFRSKEPGQRAPSAGQGDRPAVGLRGAMGRSEARALPHSRAITPSKWRPPRTAIASPLAGAHPCPTRSGRFKDRPAWWWISPKPNHGARHSLSPRKQLFSGRAHLAIFVAPAKGRQRRASRARSEGVSAVPGEAQRGRLPVVPRAPAA